MDFSQIQSQTSLNIDLLIKHYSARLLVFLWRQSFLYEEAKFLCILKYQYTNLKQKNTSWPDCLWDNYFVHQFIVNFLALLLCQMNFLDIFNIVDFFQIFVEHQNQLVLFEKPTDQFPLFICICNKYNRRLIFLK